MKRMQNVQGLRAIAALLVVVTHLGGSGGFIPGAMDGQDPLWILHPIGNAGVDLFFAISGLIMIVTTSRVQHEARSAGQFLLRRIIRIYPPYIVATLLLWSPTLRHPGFFGHMGLLLQSISLIPTGSRLPILFVGWTLTFEMYFYLVFALSVLVSARYQLAVLGGWAVLTIAMNLTFAHVNSWLGMIGSPMNLEFLFGVIVGKAVLAERLRFPVLSVAVGAASILFAYLVIAGPGAELPSTWVRVAAVGIPAALVLYGLVGLEVRGRRFPARVVQLGELSFALYLIHPLVMKVAAPAVHRLPASAATALLVAIGVTAASILAAAAFHRFVEQPLLKQFQRLPSLDLRQRPRATTAGAAP